MQDVRRRIGNLRRRQFLGPPIGQLLLLGDFDPEQIPGQIFQAMPIRVGPYQPRGNLGTINGVCHDPEGLLQHAEVESGEVEYFQDTGIRQ